MYVRYLTIAFLFITTFAHASSIEANVFDNGGGSSFSVNYEITASIGEETGEPVTTISNDYVIYAGFAGQLLNLPPEVSPAVIALGSDGMATIDLGSIISDPDYDPVTLNVSAPSGGTRSLTGSTVVYSVGAGFTGGDILTYSVSDGALTTTGTVSIVDVISPTISGSFSPVTITASTLGLATVPNYASQAAATDNSGVITSVTQSPVAGSAAGGGTLNVLITAIDAAGNSATQTVSAFVQVPTVISTQPASVTVNQGGAATFSVGATGTGPFSYQWRKGGIAISGATSASYTIASAQASDAANYYVVVTNVAGSATSATATLAVIVPPSITLQPSDLTVNQGSLAAFSVTAGGTAPFTYQWRKGGVNLTAGTASTLSIPAAQPSDVGNYDVILTNPAGSVTSNTATLSIITPPVITRPSDLQLTVDGAGFLSASVQSATPFTYYWKKGGVPIPSPSVGGITLFSGTSGAGTATAGTAVSLQLLNANDISEGVYTLVVSNSFGPVESGSATVSVDFSRPKILEAYLPKANVTYDLRAYDNGSFSGFPNPAVNESIVLNVRGPAGMTYAWSFISGTLAGGLQARLKSTSATLTFASEFPQPPGYYKCTVGAPGGGIYTSIKFWVASFGPEALIPGAGTYEGLLESSDTAVGDGARFRGLVNLTLTNRGSISGVVRYTEAAPLSGGSLQQRVYRPLSQPFVSKLTPVNGIQNRFVCAPSLGVGATGASRELALEFDCSITPPAIQARFQDHGSIAVSVRADGALSEVNRFNRIGTGLPAGFEGAVGRDVVLSNTLGSGTSGSQMYSLVQVLPSGRAVWTTRMPGYIGSSTAYLGAIDGTRLEAQVYEAQLSRSTTALASGSIFGRLSVAQGQDGKWKTTFGHGQTDGLVERQSSRFAIPASGTVTAAFQSDSFVRGTSWTGAASIDFSAGSGLRWMKAAGSALPAFLTANVPMRLRVTDPLKNSADNPVSYAWDIVILANGTVSRPLPVAENGVTAPTLTLRLDALTGQWTGGYAPPNGARRVLTGAVGNVQESPTDRSRGWVELSGEVPVLRIGTWKLEVR